MSYATQDRYGGVVTSYAHAKARDAPAGGQGLHTWWPDFGPGCKDFSQQRRSHPNEMIFEKVIAPKRWSAAGRPPPPAGVPLAPQLRDPEPARRSMLHDQAPQAARIFEAHGWTSRQAALRRDEVRQRELDATASNLYARMLAEQPASGSTALQPRALRGSQSAPAVGAASCERSSATSRRLYERHGFLVGHGPGVDGAGGVAGAGGLGRPELGGGAAGAAAGGGRHGAAPRKPTKQWRICPESSFVLDPLTCLPVPRGRALPIADWAEAPSPAGGGRAPAGDPAAAPGRGGGWQGLPVLGELAP